MTQRASAPRHRFAAPLVAIVALVLLAITAASREARAAGTVVIADRAPQESSTGRWKLQMTIDYGGTPHLNYIPMLFIFTPKVLYERALLDATGDKPVINKIPLQDQPTINESMDVGFSDGTGSVFRKTKFDFVIRRDRGFEAGEYSLEIKRAGDGVRMGSVQTITLKGDNPIVDRRAIVFSGEKKKEKKAEEPKADEPKADAPAEAEPAAEPPVAEAPIEAPPPVEPKAGGCGCRVGPTGSATAPLAAAIAVAWLAVRRRRASRRRA